MRRALAKTVATLFLLVGLTGLTGSTGSTAARAATPSPCEEARRIVGDQAAQLTDEECQPLVDAAEEERWQLWLDMALAHEHSGDLLAAMPYYNRFLASAQARQRPLTSAWSKVREDARVSVERLDAELRATHGRVDVRSTPPDAMASFEGKAAGGASHVTPFTHYLVPGTHTIELYHANFADTVTKTFTLEKGQVLTLEVDLAREVEAAKAAKAATGPAPVMVKATTAPTGDPPDPAKEGARASVWSTAGWLGVAAGVGLVSAGTVFYLGGQGEVDASRCTTEPWCAPTAAERARRSDHGQSQQDAGLAMWIAGGVLIAGGVVAILLGDGAGDDAGSASAGWRLDAVTPTLTGDGGLGVGTAWTF